MWESRTSLGRSELNISQVGASVSIGDTCGPRSARSEGKGKPHPAPSPNFICLRADRCPWPTITFYRIPAEPVPTSAAIRNDIKRCDPSRLARSSGRCTPFTRRLGSRRCQNCWEPARELHAESKLMCRKIDLNLKGEPGTETTIVSRGPLYPGVMTQLGSM